MGRLLIWEVKTSNLSVNPLQFCQLLLWTFARIKIRYRKMNLNGNYGLIKWEALIQKFYHILRIMLYRRAGGRCGGQGSKSAGPELERKASKTVYRFELVLLVAQKVKIQGGETESHNSCFARDFFKVRLHFNADLAFNPRQHRGGCSLKGRVGHLR